MDRVEGMGRRVPQGIGSKEALGIDFVYFKYKIKWFPPLSRHIAGIPHMGVSI